MAFTEVDKQIAQTADALSVTITFNSVGADLIIACLSSAGTLTVVNGDFTSSPNIGNPTGILTQQDVAGGEHCCIAYWDNFTGDATQDITFTKTYGSIAVYAMAGTSGSTFEKETTGSNNYLAGAPYTLSCVSVTPDTDDALIVQALSFNTGGNTPTIDGSYTALQAIDFISSPITGMGVASAYRIIAGTPVSSAPTWTLDAATHAAQTTAVFSLGGGGGGGGTRVLNRQLVLGVG